MHFLLFLKRKVMDSWKTQWSNIYPKGIILTFLGALSVCSSLINSLSLFPWQLKKRAIKLSVGNWLIGPRALAFANGRSRQILGGRERWFVKKESILLLQKQEGNIVGSEERWEFLSSLEWERLEKDDPGPEFILSLKAWTFSQLYPWTPIKPSQVIPKKLWFQSGAWSRMSSGHWDKPRSVPQRGQAGASPCSPGQIWVGSEFKHLPLPLISADHTHFAVQNARHFYNLTLILLDPQRPGMREQTAPAPKLPLEMLLAGFISALPPSQTLELGLESKTLQVSFCSCCTWACPASSSSKGTRLLCDILIWACRGAANGS